MQREYLQGVIEFYRTRTDTKMTIAAERLAVIAVVTLPITALASVLGMNVIVNTRTQQIPLAIALAVMITMSAFLLRWAKHHGGASTRLTSDRNPTTEFAEPHVRMPTMRCDT